MPYLPELIEFEDIILHSGGTLRVSQHGEIQLKKSSFPLYSVALGSQAPDVPVLGFFGGVHGLERIGTQVLLAFLRGLLVRLRWDSSLQKKLNTMRLVFMPLVNPAGMASGTRGNGSGIDLMRNSPVNSPEKTPFLIGGHRISPLLPWYRGKKEASLEPENQALFDVVNSELLTSSFSVALDCHSGFGLRDRLWFPYAHTKKPYPHLPETFALKTLFEQCYPHHPYIIEPQAAQYRTHGDIWDYLHLYSRILHKNTTHPGIPSRIFLPLTLELGSWLWIKKNPRQLTSLLGMFNPMVHLLLLEFLIRAVHDYQQWLPDDKQREEVEHKALSLWYGVRPWSAL